MSSDGDYKLNYFTIYFFFMIINNVFDSTVFIGQIAFFAKVSDPLIGKLKQLIQLK